MTTANQFTQIRRCLKDHGKINQIFLRKHKILLKRSSFSQHLIGREA